MAEPNYEAERRLPDGVTCADCRHGSRCEALFGAVRKRFTSCDFWPSRFSAFADARKSVIPESTNFAGGRSMTAAVLPDARARARIVLAAHCGPNSKTRQRLLADKDWRDTTVAIPTAIDAMVALAKEATPPASDAAVPAGEVVAWCSPGQLANLMDVDADGGVYLPIRKTKRGNFTMPLYAAAPKVASDTGAGLDHLSRAKARADRRATSGEVSVEGSIYEGMEACLVQHGRTIAHVPRYADAVNLAARLDTPTDATIGGRAA